MNANHQSGQAAASDHEGTAGKPRVAPVSARSSASTDAWLLSQGDAQAAVGMHGIVDVLRSVLVYDFPLMPHHCVGLSIWRGRPIPVVRLSGIFDARERAEGIMPYCAIVGYLGAAGRIGHGGILLSEPPESIRVRSDMGRFAPEGAALHGALAWFDYNGKAIPVLDLERVFSHQ